jgi:hypothetical protein
MSALYGSTLITNAPIYAFYTLSDPVPNTSTGPILPWILVSGNGLNISNGIVTVPFTGIYDINACGTLTAASPFALGITINGTTYWQNLATPGLGSPNVTNYMQMFLTKGSTISIAQTISNTSSIQKGSSSFGVVLKQRTV